MTIAGWAQIVVLLVVLTALTPLLGGYMARVYRGQRVWLTPLAGPLERLGYRTLGVTPGEEQDWKAYARSMLLFSLASWVALYIVLRTQGLQPLNPQGFISGPWNLSFNTASSFASNTSWQYYAGETTLTYFAQMAGITVASFTSCAVGMAVAVALIRSLARRETLKLGNFWVDLTRSLLYVLVPLSLLFGLFLASQGAIENLSHYLTVTGPTGLSQTIAQGPVASQEAIKLLSGDGGGFFNTNSAHPFENPTALSNFVEIVLMLLIPAALTYTFGRMVGRRRQGWALYSAMIVLFVAGTAVLYGAEAQGSPAQHAAGLHTATINGSTGGNMQDKEQRFGIAGSTLFVASGTASGDGAVNSGLEAYTGLGGAVAMANIMSGEVIFGGPGSGLYGMLLLVVLTVFIAGLMVGRTPEYLGKKIGTREIKLAVVGTLFVPILVLLTTALAVATPAGRQSLFAHGPQGFSRVAVRLPLPGQQQRICIRWLHRLHPTQPRQHRWTRHRLRRPRRRGDDDVRALGADPRRARARRSIRATAHHSARPGHPTHRHPDVRRLRHRLRDRLRAAELPRRGVSRTARPIPDATPLLRSGVSAMRRSIPAQEIPPAPGPTSSAVADRPRPPTPVGGRLRGPAGHDRI